MSTTMTGLAGSNLGVAMPGLDRRDEVGAMAKAARVFKDDAIENRRLVENAVAALTSPTWGPDDRHSRQIAVASAAAGPHVLITIGDSGSGIPAEVLPRVFEPLFTTRNISAGLGLPITRHIVEQHGGTIAIESPPEGGTTVTVWLPRPTQQAAA